MKKIIIILLLAPVMLCAQTGIKISDLPLYSSNPGNAWLMLTMQSGTDRNKRIASNVFFDTQMSSKSTSDLAEGSRQYYTVARARAAVSGINGIDFNEVTGQFSLNLAFADSRYTTNLAFGPTLNWNGEQLDVVKTKLARYTKVLADADYTVSPDDELLILPNPTTTRTLTLIPASQMQGLTLTIIGAFDVDGEWVLGGSVRYRQYGSVGTSPMAENSTSIWYSSDRARLVSVNDNGNWIWVDTK